MRAGQGRGDLQCVARALCRFRWVPYDAVPAAERRAYVRLQLLAWSPFDDSGYAVVNGRDGVMAFAWDQRAFEQRAQAAGLPAQPARTLPETLLLPAHDEGVVLQACVPGVEGQVWRSRPAGGQPLVARDAGCRRVAELPAQRRRATGMRRCAQPPRIDPGAGARLARRAVGSGV